MNEKVDYKIKEIAEQACGRQRRSNPRIYPAQSQPEQPPGSSPAPSNS